MLVSPEHRDMLNMEIWYQSIGDQYALWLIEQFKKQDDREELPSTYDIGEILVCFQSWLHDHSKVDGNDFQKIDKYIDSLISKIDKLEDTLDQLQT